MSYAFVESAKRTLRLVERDLQQIRSRVSMCVWMCLRVCVQWIRLHSFPCVNMVKTLMIFKGFACLYLPCRSARPPSMTACSPVSVPLRSKGLGDSYLIIFLSTLPPSKASLLTLLTWATHTRSLCPFGLSSFYHSDGQTKIRQVQPRDRRRILSSLKIWYNLDTCKWNVCLSLHCWAAVFQIFAKKQKWNHFYQPVNVVTINSSVWGGGKKEEKYTR